MYNNMFNISTKNLCLYINSKFGYLPFNTPMEDIIRYFKYAQSTPPYNYIVVLV
jgi:hypothetical protein